MTDKAFPTFLTREQLTAKYPISQSTLARLAHEGRGPVYYKPVDIALYDEAEFVAWIRASQVNTSASLCGPLRGGRGRRQAADASTIVTTAKTGSDGSASRRGRPRKQLQPSLFSALRADGDDAA